tara:strand:+ start:443 stop:661 length:219 start_codon:yes stop_codon:yes gene_type:complete
MTHARNVAKMDILTGYEKNECMACGYTSYEWGEVYDEKGEKITSWSEDDHVVCPKCHSFDYYFTDNEEKNDE